MKRLKYMLSIFGLTTIILLSNCTDCPPSEKIGELFLQDSSLLFHTYQGDETLIFVNSKGEKKILMTREDSNYDNEITIAVEEICESVSFLVGNSIVFYSSEHHRGSFEATSSDFLYYDISIYNIVEDGLYSRDTILYDYFYLSGVISGNGIADLNVITSHRGNFDRLDTLLNYTDDNSDYVKDTTLLDQTFKDDYRNDSESTFLFSTGVGVIAINDGHELWGH